MQAVNGTYENPATKSCFEMCLSCFRCDRRRSSSCPDFEGCSGVPDKEGMRVPNRDHVCTCREGTMRWVTKQDRLIIRKFTSNPFSGKVTTDAESEDDRDWGQYVKAQQELMQSELYDPLVFDDGTSTSDWEKKARQGKS